ncbi:MAG: SsrA-binding protein SmpB [Anaerolineales bacterium]|nr:SsrA-binding protein SmpB [Anaerolineales bacterium]
MINMNERNIATNRKARHNYIILDTYEAGLILQGSEIKSIRAGRVSIKEAYVRVEENEAWLVDAYIAPYDQASRFNHDPRRKRKLLLHRKEIWKLWDQTRQQNLAIIPLRIYLKKGRAKIEIALAKGKKLYDKRRTLAKRDAQREIERQLAKKR